MKLGQRGVEAQQHCQAVDALRRYSKLTALLKQRRELLESATRGNERKRVANLDQPAAFGLGELDGLNHTSHAV